MCLLYELVDLHVSTDQSVIRWPVNVASHKFDKFKLFQNNPFTYRSVTKPLFSKHYLKSESPKIESVEKPRMCMVTPLPCHSYLRYLKP